MLERLYESDDEWGGRREGGRQIVCVCVKQMTKMMGEEVKLKESTDH